MTKLVRLKQEALEACRFRGHDMDRFVSHVKWDSNPITSATSRCKKCGKYVQVNTRPLPNDIEIGGSAVGLGCE